MGIMMKHHFEPALAIFTLVTVALLASGTVSAGSDERQGLQIFRFDSFGDEAFWGDTIKLHQAIEGIRFGGVGPGVSPNTALAVGLKVDVDVLPRDLIANLKNGRINLDDQDTMLALLWVDRK